MVNTWLYLILMKLSKLMNTMIKKNSYKLAMNGYANPWISNASQFISPRQRRPPRHPRRAPAAGVSRDFAAPCTTWGDGTSHPPWSKEKVQKLQLLQPIYEPVVFRSLSLNQRVIIPQHQPAFGHRWTIKLSTISPRWTIHQHQPASTVSHHNQLAINTAKVKPFRGITHKLGPTGSMLLMTIIVSSRQFRDKAEILGAKLFSRSKYLFKQWWKWKAKSHNF